MYSKPYQGLKYRLAHRGYSMNLSNNPVQFCLWRDTGVGLSWLFMLQNALKWKIKYSTVHGDWFTWKCIYWHNYQYFEVKMWWAPQNRKLIITHLLLQVSTVHNAILTSFDSSTAVHPNQSRKLWFQTKPDVTCHLINELESLYQLKQ